LLHVPVGAEKAGAVAISVAGIGQAYKSVREELRNLRDEDGK
jgi:hypothetical protein